MLRNAISTFVYPTGKVHPLYGKYVGWSCVSNVVSSIESVLSTHSMLSVLGCESAELTLSINYTKFYTYIWIPSSWFPTIPDGSYFSSKSNASIFIFIHLFNASLYIF